MIKFRQKDYSIKSDVISGATLGASTGLIASKLVGNSVIKPGLKRFYPKGTKVNDWDASMITMGAGTVIGAGLGLIAGLIKESAKAVNRKTTVDMRLMQTVVDNLKKSGLKEGKDFVRDPKTASELKTKVCIVITKVSNDLKLLINTVADNKLKTVSNNIVKNLPNTGTVTKNMSDKFNDITISTISDSSADAGLVTGIAENFIHNGYPVYLVEVG
jgi:hypothetical protein